MNEKLTTIDEFFKFYSETCYFEEGDPEKLVDKECFEEAMIAFAKLKVKEAIDAIGDKVNEELEKDFITKEFILNSFDIETIK